MPNLNNESLKIHRLYKGKISTTLSVPLNNKHDLSLAYTPGVAAVCQAITSNKELAKKYTIKNRTIAVITDGSAVLGLGNIGPLAALPVMEGKCALFKKFANVDAFPLCLDTQDTEEIIKTIKYLAPVFGGINLEDITAPRCFTIERRLQAELDIPVIHDDQHGTATVVLAALINALKLRGGDKTKIKIVINGAGAAGNAITRLLINYGIKNIIVCDRLGAIYVSRPNLDEEKTELAKITNFNKQKGLLSEVLLGADVFIGVSAAGLLTKEMITKMNKRPIIFALANPIPEIMPQVAKSAGAFIVATGRSDFPNQINNVLVFPGIFKGALDNKVKKITNVMLIKAAKNLAALITKPNIDRILPEPFFPGVAEAIAKAIK